MNLDHTIMMKSAPSPLSRYSSPQVSAGYIQSTRSSSEKQKKTLKSIVKSKVIGKKISPSPKQLTTDALQKKIVGTKKDEHRATKMVGDSKSQADLSIFKGSWPKGKQKIFDNPYAEAEYMKSVIRRYYF